MPAITLPASDGFSWRRGRDAADVALTTTFGVNLLNSFQVWTEEV